jgi:hypothetical protein
VAKGTDVRFNWQVASVAEARKNKVLDSMVMKLRKRGEDGGMPLKFKLAFYKEFFPALSSQGPNIAQEASAGMKGEKREKKDFDLPKSNFWTLSRTQRGMEIDVIDVKISKMSKPIAKEVERGSVDKEEKSSKGEKEFIKQKAMITGLCMPMYRID